MTLLSGKGVPLRAADSAFLSPTGSLRPIRCTYNLSRAALAFSSLEYRLCVPIMSGRSEMRLCFLAGLSPLPGATGFPPLPSGSSLPVACNLRTAGRTGERWERSAGTWEAGPRCDASG